MDKAQRSAQNRRAALIMWSRTPDPAVHLRPARAAFDKRFYDQVDAADHRPPLTPEQRERMAGNLRRAYFIDLAAKATKARQAKAS